MCIYIYIYIYPSIYKNIKTYTYILSGNYASCMVMIPDCHLNLPQVLEIGKQVAVLGAFHPKSLALAPEDWISLFFKPWPAVQWVAMKLIGMPTSASFCEHAWSVQGWIHSKRRNRLSNSTVEKLVRAHCNMVLRESMENRKDEGLLLWDVELLIEDAAETPDMCQGIPDELLFVPSPVGLPMHGSDEC